MKGKERCRILKEIRIKIAEENGIEFAVSECTHKGDCRGTCPKCEAEVKYLERELEIRKRLGKSIAVAGVAAGITLSAVGCTYIEEKLGGDTLQGDMRISETIEEVDGILATEDDSLLPSEGEILMGEPVEYPIPEAPEDLEGEDSEYVNLIFTNRTISEVFNLWGEPDMIQTSGNIETHAYFTETHDVVLRTNGETGIVESAQIIVNE